MKRSFLATILLSCASLSGCVTMDMSNYRNNLSKSVSSFDDTQNIRMKNMACGDVELELYQDTNKSKLGTVLLSAGTRDIENIGRGKSLLFKVDGKQYSYAAISEITDHGEVDLNINADIPYSHKSYVLSENFVRKVANAGDVRVKLHLLNNTYVEGYCSPQTYEKVYAETEDKHKMFLTHDGLERWNQMAATNGFKKFATAMDETFQ